MTSDVPTTKAPFTPMDALADGGNVFEEVHITKMFWTVFSEILTEKETLRCKTFFYFMPASYDCVVFYRRGNRLEMLLEILVAFCIIECISLCCK